MNNDNDLNLHSMTKLSGWLRYWLCYEFNDASLYPLIFPVSSTLMSEIVTHFKNSLNYLSSSDKIKRSH